MKFLEITPRFGLKKCDGNIMINLDNITSVRLFPNEYGNYLIRLSQDQVEVSKVDLARILAAIKE